MTTPNIDVDRVVSILRQQLADAMFQTALLQAQLDARRDDRLPVPDQSDAPA